MNLSHIAFMQFYLATCTALLVLFTQHTESTTHLSSISKRFIPFFCQSQNICYTEPVDVGCFSIKFLGEFCRHGVLPQSPAELDPVFHVYSTNDTHSVIHLDSIVNDTKSAVFSTEHDIVLIIHGWGSNNKTWMMDMMNAFQQHKSVNIILCYWLLGAASPNYMQAAANTRVMGALMAHLIKLINRYHKISYDQISIVGFSLGAHAAGFAGKRFSGTKLKAIYGLDPAGPLFSKANPNRLYGTVPPGERLSRTDAQYVQVFHTSGDVMWRGGAGTLERLGDEDYYVNGGRLQLGCSEAIGATAFALRALLSTDLSNDFVLMQDDLSCNHKRAIYVFIDTIKSPCHIAFQCGNEEEWNNGECFGNTKVIAGYSEDPPSINKTSESSTFYFDTLAERFDENGFCAELFCLQVTTNVTSEASVDITIRNNQGQSLYSTQVRKGSARYMNFTANETQSIIVALPRGFVTVENYTVTVFAKYSHKSVIARNETLEIPAQTTLVDGDGIAHPEVDLMDDDSKGDDGNNTTDSWSRWMIALFFTACCFVVVVIVALCIFTLYLLILYACS